MRTDEPARDADQWASRPTPPVAGICAYCHAPIYGRDLSHDGEEYINTIDGPVHWECWMQYGLERRKEAVNGFT